MKQMTKPFTAEDFNIGSFWETREGAKVEITENYYKTHPTLNLPYGVHGIMYERGARARFLTFDSSGTYETNFKNEWDLIRRCGKKKRVKGWLNFYAFEDYRGWICQAQLYPTKSEADENAAHVQEERIGCIYIHVEEGEGVDEKETHNG